MQLPENEGKLNRKQKERKIALKQSRAKANRKKEKKETARKQKEKNTIRKKEERKTARKQKEKNTIRKKEEKETALKQKQIDAIRKQEEKETARKQKEINAIRKQEEREIALKQKQIDAIRKQEEKETDRKQKERDAIRKKEEKETARKQKQIDAIRKQEEREIALKQKQIDAIRKQEEREIALKQKQIDAIRKQKERYAIRGSADFARYLADAPPAFLLNTLFSGKFKLKKIERGKRSVAFTVYAADCIAVEELLDKRHIPYKLLYIKGARTRAESLTKRLGLIVGVLVGIILLTTYYFSLTNIELEGNSRISSEIIYQAVEAQGIKTPSFSFGVDYKKLESELIKIDGIASVSVRKEGTSLYIEILEELTQTDITDTQTPIPLIAEDSGIVTRIVALQGTVLVKAGDTVRKGDVLIAPYITDAEGVEQPVRAMGKVYAKVWYERHILYPDKLITAVRTGRSETKTAMWVLDGKYIPTPSFKNYQIETEEKHGAAIVPFTLVEFTFYEVEEREIDFDFDKKAIELIEKGYMELEKNIPESAKKLRKWYIIKKLDKSTQLSIYYEVEKRI
ncbi:MAG: sporulation protein YqfD [Clostridia bacterium]